MGRETDRIVNRKYYYALKPRSFWCLAKLFGKKLRQQTKLRPHPRLSPPRNRLLLTIRPERFLTALPNETAKPSKFYIPFVTG